MQIKTYMFFSDILHPFHVIFIINFCYQYSAIQKNKIEIFLEIHIYSNLYPEYDRYTTIYTHSFWFTSCGILP